VPTLKQFEKLEAQLKSVGEENAALLLRLEKRKYLDDVLRQQEVLDIIDHMIRRLDPGVLHSNKDVGYAIISNLRDVSQVARDAIRRNWASYWD
jgi:regulator of replication initiation timing